MGKARAEVLEALRIARSEISSWAGRRAALESESSHACLNSSDASVLGFASRFLSPIVPTLSPTVANFDSLCKDCCELRHPLPLVSRSHAGPSSAQALAETMRSSPALGWQVQRIGEGTIQRTAAKESSEQETCCSRVLSSYAAHDNVRNDATRERVMSAQKRQYEELLGIERDSIRQQEKRQFERTELQSQIVSLQEQLENKQEDEMDEKRNCDGAPQHGPWHLGTLTPDSARLEAESLLAEARQAAEQIKESTKTEMEQVRKAIAMKLAAKAEAKQVKAEAEEMKREAELELRRAQELSRRAESKDTSNISPHPSLDRPVYAFGPPIQNDVDNNCLHLRCSHCESTIAQMKQLQDTHTKELQQARQESEDLRAGCERKCREIVDLMKQIQEMQGSLNSMEERIASNKNYDKRWDWEASGHSQAKVRAESVTPATEAEVETRSQADTVKYGIRTPPFLSPQREARNSLLPKVSLCASSASQFKPDEAKEQWTVTAAAAPAAIFQAGSAASTEETPDTSEAMNDPSETSSVRSWKSTTCYSTTGTSTSSALAKRTKVGIGLFFQRSTQGPGGEPIGLEVKSILKGSSADECGMISVGDEIIAVNGQQVTGDTLAGLASKILGEANGSVECCFRRKCKPALESRTDVETRLGVSSGQELPGGPVYTVTLVRGVARKKDSSPLNLA